MKKVLFGVLAVCGVVYGADSCPDRTEDKSEYYDEKEAYSGAYIGAGLSYQHNNNHVSVSDNYADVMAMIAYWGNKDVDKARKDNPNADNMRLNGKSKKMLGGAVNVGYGQFVNSYLYVGADLTVDIAGDGKSAEKAVKAYKDTTVKNSGVIPTVAVKVGGYIPGVNILTCARFGAAFVEAKAINNEYLENELKIRKVTPIVGLSLEKYVGHGFFVKLEGDYRFPVEKENKVNGPLCCNVVRFQASEKAQIRSYGVRLMCTYRFK